MGTSIWFLFCFFCLLFVPFLVYWLIARRRFLRAKGHAEATHRRDALRAVRAYTANPQGG